MKTSREIYNERNLNYEQLLQRQKNVINFISVLRLLIFVSGIGFALYFYIYKRYYFSASLVLISLVAFFTLVFKHSKVIENKNLVASLMEVNMNALKRISGEWRSFSDNGEDFRNQEHSYSEDLDVFGQSSLFQWVNTSFTMIGREKLATLLSAPKLDKNEIEARQKAIMELSKKIGWRQRLAAEGNLIAIQNRDISDLLQWSVKKTVLANIKLLYPILFLLPIATCTSIIYTILKPSSGYSLPLIFIAISIIMLKANQKLSKEVLDTCYRYKKSIKAYFKMLILIENKNFNSPLLKELKNKVINSEELKASKAIIELSKIADRISDRSNFFNIIINILFLHDYHLILELEKWKRLYGMHIKEWLHVIGEFESLSSLSNIAFDNPEWVFPVITTEELSLKVVEAAHPLLPQDAVSNSVELGNEHTALLITGSNMSGKSTFLRTLGVNLVLAYAGVPVRAKGFFCSLMNIYTCMRISDNLNENISSFYAEILRIKKVVKATKEGEPIFYLLDEIFKGTNSTDRHLGAQTLINTLSNEQTLGLVSTHDLELSNLEKKNGKVKNYNFQEYYKDNEIKFDYKLREGVSSTRNAIYLMKMAGIEFKQDEITHILT